MHTLGSSGTPVLYMGCMVPKDCALPGVHRRFVAMFKVNMLLCVAVHLLEGGPFSELSLRNLEVLCT